jgi:hypothetical protein
MNIVRFSGSEIFHFISYYTSKYSGWTLCSAPFQLQVPFEVSYTESRPIGPIPPELCAPAPPAVILDTVPTGYKLCHRCRLITKDLPSLRRAAERHWEFNYRLRAQYSDDFDLFRCEIEKTFLEYDQFQ